VKFYRREAVVLCCGVIARDRSELRQLGAEIVGDRAGQTGDGRLGLDRVLFFAEPLRLFFGRCDPDPGSRDYGRRLRIGRRWQQRGGECQYRREHPPSRRSQSHQRSHVGRLVRMLEGRLASQATETRA
jgi:hypothetical protein